MNSDILMSETIAKSDDVEAGFGINAEDGLPYWFGRGMRETIRFYDSALENASKAGGYQAERMTRKLLAEEDWFFLAVFVLKRLDICHEWIFERCREVQAKPYGYLDLWAREHYKSTLITFVGTIAEIIRNPEITIGIFSHTRPIAKAFLRQIKLELERNEELKDLWPDVFYKRTSDSPKWSEDEGIVVRRKGNPKESTIEAWGLVDGQPVSKHFDIRHYDDIVVEASIYTPDQIERTTKGWENSTNLGKEGGLAKYAGTRWHLFDTYSQILKRGSAFPRIYPATSDGTEATIDKPVLMKAETLREKRRDQGAYVFSSQMLLNPVADKAMGFRPDWWQLASVPETKALASLNRYIIVDPASKQKKNSDYTAMIVIGVGADKKYYVLDMIYDRLNLTGRATALFSLHRRWQPIGVGYEEYGMQADIEHIEYMMKEEIYNFHIVKLGGRLSKPDRIKRLMPLFENRRVFFPEAIIKISYTGVTENLVERFKNEEYLAFPVGAHDDMFDALSRILDHVMYVRFPDSNQKTNADKFDYQSIESQGGHEDDDAGNWMLH